MQLPLYLCLQMAVDKPCKSEQLMLVVSLMKLVNMCPDIPNVAPHKKAAGPFVLIALSCTYCLMLLFPCLFPSSVHHNLIVILKL